MNRLKVSKEESENLNIRSDEVKEIMGHIPNRIIQYGIGIIAVVLIAIMVFSFFFRYPDVINGSFYVQSSNPPAFMLSSANGKLQALYVNEGDSVEKGDLLAVVESSVNIRSYLQLKQCIKELNVLSVDSFQVLPELYSLGSLQGAYAALSKATNDLINFKELNYHQRKTTLLVDKMKELNKQFVLQKKQLKATRENYVISQQQFIRDSLLYMDKTIATAEYQKAQKLLLNESMQLNSAELNLSNTIAALNELDSRILELELVKSREEESLKAAYLQAMDIVSGDIAQWERQHCLLSPIKGKVAFSGVWEENQNIRTGQHVMTVLPFEPSTLLAKVSIPIHRAGKVKVDQRINLKFADFPYREYGLLNAQLASISQVPDSAYIGTISLPDSLLTNYGKLLPYKPNMQGLAEIITEDLSLAERMIYPLKAIFEEHVN